MNPELGLLDTIVKTLGAPGLILICLGGPSLVMAFMYSDHRRYERERLEVVKADGVRQAQAVEERAKVEARHQDEMGRMERQLMSVINQQDKCFASDVQTMDKTKTTTMGTHNNEVGTGDFPFSVANSLTWKL